MKSIIFILAVAFSMTTISAAAQVTRNYKNGTVWEVTLVKTKTNMAQEYLNSLKNTWKMAQEEGTKAGYVMSYKILQSDASNPQDWDVMLMVEYKDLASMEANADKFEALVNSKMGGDEGMKKTNESRINIREVFGVKTMREVVYK